MLLIPILNIFVLIRSNLKEYSTHSNTEEVCLFGGIWYSFQYLLGVLIWSNMVLIPILIRCAYLE